MPDLARFPLYSPSYAIALIINRIIHKHMSYFIQSSDFIQMVHSFSVHTMKGKTLFALVIVVSKVAITVFYNLFSVIVYFWIIYKTVDWLSKEIVCY